jgi:hypothetical protein
MTQLTPPLVPGSKSAPGSLSCSLKTSQKRPREDTAMPEVENNAMDPRQKRKKTKDAFPYNNDYPGSVIPISMLTEDISDEVERRLKLREERRRKRNAKPEKRRRDSIDSSDVILSSENPRKFKKQKLRGESSKQP